MYVYGDISTDARVQRAANALADDFDVTLVSTDFGKTIEHPNYKLIQQKTISKHPLLNYWSTVRQTVKLLKQERADIFYAHDYYSAWIAKKMFSRKYCKKIVYDAHELIIPEEGKPFTLRQRLFYYFEKSIIKKVDLLICASPERAKIMVDHYGLKNTPNPIRNISQLTINNDEETNKVIDSLSDFFAKLGRTIVYAGVVNRSRKIDELVDAVGQLAPSCKLLIVGGGDFLEGLKQVAAKYPDMVSAFTGKVPYMALGAILSKCDAGFIYYPTNSLNNIYCASNKIYEYASVNLPIISNNNPIIKGELDKYNIGKAGESFKDSIEDILKNADAYKANMIQYNEDNQWTKESNKLNALIKGI